MMIQDLYVALGNQCNSLTWKHFPSYAPQTALQEKI